MDRDEYRAYDLPPAKIEHAGLRRVLDRLAPRGVAVRGFQIRRYLNRAPTSAVQAVYLPATGHFGVTGGHLSADVVRWYRGSGDIDTDVDGWRRGNLERATEPT
jgi:hypothetical protein